MKRSRPRRGSAPPPRATPPPRRAKGRGRLRGAARRRALPELAIYDARLLGGPGPNEPTLVRQVEVKGCGGLALDQLVFVDAQTGTVQLNINQIETAKNRSVCDADKMTGRATTPSRATRRRPTSRRRPIRRAPATTPTFAPRSSLRATPTTSTSHASGATASTATACRSSRPSTTATPPTRARCRTRSGTASRWPTATASPPQTTWSATSSPTASPSSARTSSTLPVGRDQRVAVRRVRRVRRPDQRRGNDTAGVKWQLGEDLPGGGIRNMKDPGIFNDPDRMTSPNYTIDQGEGDAGGVHTNSGVNNKAAYLITDGTAVSPAAPSTAARSPAWASPRRRASTTRSRPPSSPRAATTPTSARALTQACDNLVGTVGITAADCTQVAMPSQPPRWPRTRRTHLRPRPGRPLRRQSGASEPVLRRHGEPSGDDNWFTDDLSAWGFDNSYAHSGDIHLTGCGSRPPASARSNWTRTSRSQRARRRSCASTTPTGSRTRARPRTSTAACSSSAPTAARRSRTSAACRSMSATTATSSPASATRSRAGPRS